MIKPKDILEKLFNPGNMPKLANDELHYIDLHIIDGCNFNCARCFKFAPLCKNLGLVDKDALIKDIKQLAKITKKKLDGISIIGGEPLISPDINTYMKECRKAFPNTDITIISNGLAIPNMPTKFFKDMIKYDVKIAISKYFENDFYIKITDTLNSNGCSDRYVFSKVEGLGCAMFLQMNLDRKGKSDPEEIWNKCSAKNGCVLLKDRKLWSCSNHCMKYIINNYFKLKMIDYEEDGISIYDHSYKEIIEHLKKPKKGCRYCTEDIYNCMYFPEHTQHKLSEWVKD